MNLKDLIGKEVTVEISVKEADVKWILKLLLSYDSLRKPKHRIVACDRKGNAVFIML